jgi:DNA-binding NarL/FixJ family response regulator
MQLSTERPRLTPRQTVVLEGVVAGHRNVDIAAQMNIATRTVEIHRYNLMKRLGVHNVAQLIRKSIDLRLLDKKNLKLTKKR